MNHDTGYLFLLYNFQFQSSVSCYLPRGSKEGEIDLRIDLCGYTTGFEREKCLKTFFYVTVLWNSASIIWQYSVSFPVARFVLNVMHV